MVSFDQSAAVGFDGDGVLKLETRQDFAAAGRQGQTTAGALKAMS